MLTFVKNEHQPLSDHFNSDEFDCHCNTAHVNYIDPKLIQCLEKLRSLAGNKPIRINSGYRCEAHNKAIGGVLNSQHTQGTAADIVILDGKGGVIPWKVGKLAAKAGFDGIGVYDTFVHVDVRGEKARWRG